MIDLNENQLAELLKKAAKAHGKYEKVELYGKYDKEWPKWYAKWMLEYIAKHSR